MLDIKLLQKNIEYVIEKLNSEVFFKRNTPSEIHYMYNRILKRFKNLDLVSELTADSEINKRY